MHLSISNFDMAAVLKTIGTLVLTIFVAWIVTPGSFVFDEEPVPGSSALNELVIEQYIHEYQKKPILLLGSSIQTMVPPPNCRPDNVATIYLQGRSAMSGLEALRRTAARPQTVFIEIPTLLIGVDQELINTVFTPLYWRIRSIISPLRHERNWLVLLYRWRHYERSPPPFALQDPPQSVDEWKRLMAPRTPAFVNRNDDRTIGLILPDLVWLVRALQQQGTRVLFYNPIDPALRALSPMKDLHAALRAAFPEIEVIEAPDDEFPIYRWDGMHLVDASGLRLFEYLMRRAGLSVQKKCQVTVKQPPSR
jgi:hypothetical protein